MSKRSKKRKPRSNRIGRAGLFGGQRSLDVGLLGLFVGRQIGLRGLARRAQAFDVLIHGAQVLLCRFLHAPPRHRRAAPSRLFVGAPFLLGPRGGREGPVRGLRGPPPAPPAPPPPPPPPPPLAG